ncbi:sigma-70 family RNA polymerase sigma factor [Pseudonocardia spinosispora]|uniref:RNA polymerase sigma factor n=1 Tax=Pseudonocardia spinosispora TaxID=103441 RepID=UPI0005685449
MEDLLREITPQVLGVLMRRYGQFDSCEDAVQEALLAATVQWPDTGTPDNPRGWMITVAANKMVDHIRSENARRRREENLALEAGADEYVGRKPGEDYTPDRDDTLTLLFLCCHPSLTPASQVALTLRAVGGLTTGQIASAFLVPEATMGPRISRAKKTIKAAGAAFVMPPEQERDERLSVVLHVLYLIFNEGYTASHGEQLHRHELAAEAIRLTRAVHRLLPGDGEVAGLLALMLLTDARRPARTDSRGGLVPLAEQDRTKWEPEPIAEGSELIADAMARFPLGPYQLQAAIAAVHVEASCADETDWAQIEILYRILERRWPNPMVTLNRAIAVAMTQGPRIGLELLDTVGADRRMTDHHRLAAVRAHLLEMAGDLPAARAAYELAARRTASIPEQRYLTARAARLT